MVSDPHPFHADLDPGFEIFAHQDPGFEIFLESDTGLILFHNE
jgi:hypothetical protein